MLPAAGSRVIGYLAVATFLVALALPSFAVTAPSWPPGTTVIPFTLRGGLILVRVTLQAPGGRASGMFVFDTGAPGLTVSRSVWDALQLDTGRPIDTVDLGDERLTHLSVNGVIPDGILDDEFMGLIGPSLLGDRAIVVDYEDRTLAVVNRSLTLMSRDTSLAGNWDRASLDRVQRSRARYGAVLPARAAAVPFRMFRGGRMLATARVEETSPAWRSQPLTLLIDTGASACAIFADAADTRVGHVGRWPKYPDMPFRTVLGESRTDLVLLPRLTLPGAIGLVSERAVEASLPSRHALPDIEGELPDPVHGLLGYSFFRRFRLVIDYSDEVLWLSPATPAGVASAPASAPATARAATGATGLVLESAWGKTSVAAVTPKSAAAASGVQPGDEVVSIDGTPVTDVDPADAQQLLDDGSGIAVVIVRRGGMQHVLRLPRHRVR